MIRIFLVALFFPSVLWAEASSSPVDMNLPEITVFGATPKSSTLDFVPTVGEISGSRLNRKKQSTIGESLSRETGVTSSQFGPNSSRPVIRGMEGDRIRVLQNGTGVLDASAASPDHAVAIDPLIIDRVEIVRGPAALLYGSSAVGGVVNMVTSRIPEKVPDRLTGRAESKFSSTDLGRSAGGGIEGALTDRWVIHVDGSVRGADDYRVPGFARTDEVRAAEPLDPENKGRVYNSFNHSGTQALGTSYIFDKGFVGTSFSNLNSTYGPVAEREIKIQMLQQRWDVGGEIRNLGFIKSIRAKNSYSRYKHDEIENGEPGTSFKNDGDEARIDLKHEALFGLTGVFGVQANLFNFSAKGEEAFLPGTDNRTVSAFVYEEREKGDFKPSFGARVDAANIISKDEPNFGPGESKSFTGGSFSLGFLYQFTPNHAFVLNGAYTERAPNYQELFADGRHVATAQHEKGDPNLRKERSQSVELSWRHKGDNSHGSIGIFLQDFKDYITLVPRGEFDSDPEKQFEYYDFKSVDARLYGAELDYRYQFHSLIPGGTLEVELKADLVRGINRSTGDYLPRMTPIRETLGFIYKADSFQTDLEVQRSERQTRTAPNETRTDAYTLVNVGVEVPLKKGELASVDLFARVNNIFDIDARNHVSQLKDLAPLPGRNFMLGAQATF